MSGQDEPRKTARAEEGGFLDRWSRRKAEARTVEKTAAVTPAAVEGPEEAGALPADETASPPPAFDIESLPDIDSLGPGSDFSMFMRPGVPASLKTKALRKLWRVKPELANLDGLLDYGEDLTGSFKVVDHLKTAYEVGRGFLRDQAEAAPEKPGDDPGDAPEQRPEDAPREEGAGPVAARDAAADGPSAPDDPLGRKTSPDNEAG